MVRRHSRGGTRGHCVLVDVSVSVQYEYCNVCHLFGEKGHRMPRTLGMTAPTAVSDASVKTCRDVSFG